MAVLAVQVPLIQEQGVLVLHSSLVDARNIVYSTVGSRTCQVLVLGATVALDCRALAPGWSLQPAAQGISSGEPQLWVMGGKQLAMHTASNENIVIAIT